MIKPLAGMFVVAVFAAGCSSGQDAAPAPAGASPAARTAAAAAPARSGAGATLAPSLAPGKAVHTAPSGAIASGTGYYAQGERARRAVAAFYAAYLAKPGKATAQRYLTPQLAAAMATALPDRDPVFCGPILPTSVSTTITSVNPDSATVSVVPVVSGAKQAPLLVTVRLADHRIARIDCPS